MEQHFSLNILRHGYHPIGFQLHNPIRSFPVVPHAQNPGVLIGTFCPEILPFKKVE
jgi:hypothetical protein